MIFITYLGKMVLCSGILLGYYWLFLRNRRFHHYNRFYLLATLVLSIVLPFIKIPVFEDPGMLNRVAYNTARIITLPPVTQAEGLPVEELPSSTLFTLSNLLCLLYGVGLVFLLFTLGRGLWYIRKISRRYSFEVVEKLKFYQTREPGTPFSFFQSIFWNDQLNFNSAQGQQIFRHELFHVQQKHTADILLAEVITTIGWFNPFFHLIKKELKAIHEFLADQYAASGSNQYQYAELLVQQVLTLRQQSLTHHFFQTQLKRRIAMITQLNQSKYGYWSRVMVLPVSLLLFFSMTLHAGQQKEEPKKDVYQTLDKDVYRAQERDVYRTDTVPTMELKAAKETRMQEIRNQQLMLEKMLQEKAVKGNAEQKELKQKLEELTFEYKTGQKKQLEEAQLYNDKEQFFYNEERIKGTELEKIRIKQELLEQILKKKETQADRNISNQLQNELQLLKMQEKVLQEKRLYADETSKDYVYDKAVKTEGDVAILLQKKAAEQQQLLIAKEIKMKYEKAQLQQQQKVDGLKLQLQKEQALLEASEARKKERLEAAQRELANNYKMKYADDSVQITIIRFFNKNFRYPQELIDHGGEGSIWYSVLLDETGKLKDYEIYQSEPAAAQGNVQEIVIVGFVHKDKVLGAPLSEEKIREMIHAEIIRLSAKDGNLFGTKKVPSTRYFYKATFRLEKGK